MQHSSTKQKEMLPITIDERTQVDGSYEYAAVLLLVPSDSYVYCFFFLHTFVLHQRAQKPRAKRPTVGV